MNETIIISLTVVLTVLAYIAYQLYQVRKSLPKRDYLAEKQLKSDQKFFRKFANIKGTGFRTTTLTFLIQIAIEKSDQLKLLQANSLAPLERVGNKILVNDQAILIRPVSNKNAINNINLYDIECSETDYRSYIKKLGIILKAVCPCPNQDDRLCPWEVPMLKRFILDTGVINFISLQIFHLDDRIISSSTYNQIQFNHNDSKYGVIEMNNHDLLDALKGGTKVKIVVKFTPVDSDEILCLTLLIQIPTVDDLPGLSSQNGQLLEERLITDGDFLK